MEVEHFIEKWKRSGGNERANTHMFITDLCDLLELPRPEPTQPETGINDYVFERHVVKTEIDGATSNGWIDLYKRDCFILEAKQGSTRDVEAFDKGLGDSLRDLFGQTAADRFKRGMAKRGTGQWASAMQRAAGQAEGYAKALPKEHAWPPFLLVSDVGYCIDVYANFARDGRSYAPFPGRRKFRIELDDLRNEKVRERICAIWLEPMSLDPSAEAARVTREVAAHLAALAKDIEAREQNPDRVAAFLMRLLFTMFAEDTGLIPKKSFSDLLTKHRDEPEVLGRQVTSLWTDMDHGGHAAAIAKHVPQINGWLFKDRNFIELKSGEIDVLIKAAEANWDHVEPAIFGTLLERALNPKERAKLGAHYTPRAYVERLVQPTIMEPLREDWLGARTAAMEAAEAGDKEKARLLVEEFHGKLARTKVLDPACGTGNFLYVTMARMKELEGEVLELLEELGDRQYLAEISGHTITPENFLGIELNPRAAEIAQLVLWIGYLQWHFRVNGEDRMPEPPVLRDVKTIECRDALIEWDRTELERDQYGRPVTRWNGETKPHPVTGKPVPDETAQVEVMRYINPRAAKWPKADFIIGNPPFIGNKRMRDRLGDGYFEALFRTTAVRESADFVMHWWHKAARTVRKHQARRFGLITTNSLHQTFNRKVIAEHLSAIDPLSIAFAIPDHPWVDETGSAAVRVSMTVGTAGTSHGQLLSIEDGDFRTGEELFSEQRGRIDAALQSGRSLVETKKLKANRGLASLGITFVGQGFLLEEAERNTLLAQEPAALDLLRNYISGRDISGRDRKRFAIDTYGLSEAELENQYPQIYQRLLTTVRPEREHNNRKSYRDLWWLAAEPRSEIRRALEGLTRFIVTPRTSKHRTFQFVESDTLPEARVVAVALCDGFYFGVLTSSFHTLWAVAWGARQGVGNDLNYNVGECFDRFPFPDASDESRKQRTGNAAEKLNALRKEVLERHADLTLTKLYNVLDALRNAEASGGTLEEKDRDIAERGCVSLIRQYHDEIDAAVAEAYGWGDLIEGKDTSSTGPGRTSWVSGANEIILERLVALNKERAAEEARGKVRWLRPEFQSPRYVAPEEQAALALPEAEKAAEICEWPAKLAEQVVAVASIVERVGRPVAANDVASAFKGKRAGTVTPVLDALASMGRVRKLDDGRYAA